jgi:predicted TIM-barrel fold metal-dependent hydrolase
LQALDGVKEAADSIGANRVLFGSGLPLQYPECGLVKIRQADLSDEEKALILGGNAARLFGLPDKLEPAAQGGPA